MEIVIDIVHYVQHTDTIMVSRSCLLFGLLLTLWQVHLSVFGDLKTAQSAPNLRDGGTSYCVEGILTVSNVVAGRFDLQNTYTFRVMCSGSRWRLEATEANRMFGFRGGPSSARQFAFGCDGTDVYAVVHLLPAGPRSDSAPELPNRPALAIPVLGKPITNTSSPVLQGYVSPGTQPTFDPPLRLIWFALLSGDFLTQVPLPPIIPFWGISAKELDDYHLTSTNTSEAIHDSLTFAIRPASFGLPESAVITSVVPNPLRDPSPSLKRSPRTYTSGLYSTEAWTNWSTGALPLSFTFTRYLAPAGATADGEPSTSSILRGEITRLLKWDRKEWLPETQEGLKIVDYRFVDRDSSVSSLKYALTADGWRASSDERLRELMSKTLATARQYKRTVATKRTPLLRPLMMTLIGLVAAFPLALAAYKKRQRTEQHQTPQSRAPDTT